MEKLFTASSYNSKVLAQDKLNQILEEKQQVRLPTNQRNMHC